MLQLVEAGRLSGQRSWALLCVTPPLRPFFVDHLDCAFRQRNTSVSSKEVYGSTLFLPFTNVTDISAHCEPKACDKVKAILGLHKQLGAINGGWFWAVGVAIVKRLRELC